MIVLKLASQCPVCESRLKYEDTSGTWHCFTCSVRQNVMQHNGGIFALTVAALSPNAQPSKKYQ